MTTPADSLFQVAATALPDDAARVCPLTGNDEIKLVLDARGCMHDYTPAQGSWAPPRIIWTGRRHGRTIDRYNSNLFEWGFANVQLLGEDALGPVAAWRQRLDPRHGLVETTIEHAGGAVMTAESFVHLDRNVLVLHRRYTGLPAGAWRARAVWTFCQVGTDAIPYRTTFAPLLAWESGIAADVSADGLVVTRGRVALLASTPAGARAIGNRLEVDAPLAADGSVTFYLTFADDLGNDPMLVDTPLDDFMSPLTREVNREIRATPVVKPDPVAVTDDLRAWLAAGYPAVRASQLAAWQAFHDGFTLRLPAAEPELQAILDTQLYTIRCSYSRYSLPAAPFNPSWGAGYFWDEQFPMLGLMACGDMEMPRRILEFRRRCLPFSSRMCSGKGARYPSCVTESGQQLGDRNGTQHYEFHQLAFMVNYAWLYCSYHDDEATWRRYYPIIRECAEFHRHWLLVELPGNYAMIVPGIDVEEAISAYDDGPAMACGAALSLHLAADIAGKLGIDEPDLPEWRRLAALAARLAKDVGDGFYHEFDIGRVPQPVEPADPAVVEWRRVQRAKRRHVGDRHASATVSGDPEMVSEWAWGHLNNAYVLANQGKAAEALAAVRRTIPLRLDYSALCESCSPDHSRLHHPWFTTGAGAFLRTVARLILLPGDDTIRLFPGLPHGAWQDLEFRLMAFGNVEVHGILAGGSLTTLELRRRAPGATTCRLAVPAAYLPAGVSLPPGPVTVDEHTLKLWEVAP